MQAIAIKNAPDTAETQAEMQNPSDPIEDQRQNFTAWLKRKKLSVRAVATAAGMTETPLRFYKSGKTRDLRHENKIRIAKAFDTTVIDIFGDAAGIGEIQSAPTPIPPAMPMTVPVMARIENGQLRETTRPATYVESPPGMALSGTVYALRCPNSNMEPRFRQFEVLLCEPTTTPGAGDDCAVHLEGGTIHILRCVEYTPDGGFIGTTYAAPDRTTSFPASDITKTARIVGMLMGV